MYCIDISNQKFGNWTVISKSERTLPSGGLYWNCICVCGKEKEVYSRHLRTGRSKGCGCNRAEITRHRNLIHGMSKTRFYKIWLGMIKRCHNPKSSRFQFYGGKGIVVKKDWHIFMNFHRDMYKSYLAHTQKHGEKNTTIERINSRDNYTKQNCKWETWEKQYQNRRHLRFITYNKQTLSVSAWARQLNIPVQTLFTRLKKMSDIRALQYGQN